MAEVKCNVTNNDPDTGKKIKAFLSGAPLGFGGYPIHVSYILKYKEIDDVTDAIPPANTSTSRNSIKDIEETFYVTDRKISGVTKLYLPDDTVDINAVSLKDYFANKIINTYQGTGGGDPAWKFAEGVLKEVISIRQLNGELPV